MKLFLASLAITCTLLLSCGKEYSGEGSPSLVVFTTAVSGITATTAVSGGTITTNSISAPVIERGVCWSLYTNPTTSGPKTTDGSGPGNFASSLSGLTTNTTYFIRAYATTPTGTTYGSQRSFKTEDITSPTPPVPPVPVPPTPPVPPAPPTVTVGATYGGGTVGYVLVPGNAGYDPAVPHGIIVAPQATVLYDWSLQDFGTFVLTNATGTAIGTGQANTNKILAVEGPGVYAAQYCNDLVLNGYSDWYLPSKDELTALFNNNATIGGFPNSGYWTSTETDITGANFLLIIAGSGSMQSGYKGSNGYVRAVRSF